MARIRTGQSFFYILLLGVHAHVVVLNKKGTNAHQEGSGGLVADRLRGFIVLGEVLADELDETRVRLGHVLLQLGEDLP